jgi:hypothetical protein
VTTRQLQVRAWKGTEGGHDRVRTGSCKCHDRDDEDDDVAGSAAGIFMLEDQLNSTVRYGAALYVPSPSISRMSWGS